MEKSEQKLNPMAGQVVAILLSDIYVDYKWNSRSYSDVIGDSDGAQVTAPNGEIIAAGVDINGLAESLREQGQDTPVHVMRVQNNTSLGGNGTFCKYELVAGFRRFTAKSRLKAERIDAIVKELSPLDARVLNLRENTGRSSLKQADMVMGVRELTQAGLSCQEIGKKLSLFDGYVARLIQAGSLPEVILKHWQLGSTIRVPGLDPNRHWPQAHLNNMTTLNRLAVTEKAPEAITIQRYVNILQKKANSFRPKPKGESNKSKMLAKAERTAILLADLCLLKIIKPGTLDWSKVFGPKTEGFLVNTHPVNPKLIVERADEVFSRHMIGKAPPQRKRSRNHPLAVKPAAK